MPGAQVVAVRVTLGRQIVEPGMTDRVVVAQRGVRRIGAPRAAAVPVHERARYRPVTGDGWTVAPEKRDLSA
jgi:hypothetical protein